MRNEINGATTVGDNNMLIGSKASRVFLDVLVEQYAPGRFITVIGFAKMDGTNILMGRNLDLANPDDQFLVAVHIRRKPQNLVLFYRKGQFYVTHEKRPGLHPFKARELRRPIKRAISDWLVKVAKGEERQLAL